MKRYIVNLIIRFSLIFNNPYVPALILKFVLNKNKKSKFNILCFSKPIFEDDINSIQSITKDITFQKMPVFYLTSIVKYFISNYDSLNDANYHILASNKLEIDRLRSYLFKFFEILRKINHFDLVITGNFVYTQQQEMFVVLKQLEIPSVVIYKEGMMPLIKFKTAKEFLYKTKVFRSNYIFFYNNLIRDTVVNSNIPGLTKNKTKVIGIPRFDKYFNYSKKAIKNTIVLFSFEPFEKGNYLVDDKSKMISFIKEVTNFHQIFAEACLKNENLSLVVKTKSSKQAVEFAESIYESYKTSLGSRLVISNSLNTENLIKNSSFIAGFSSTTLIEGLILKRTLICPKFNNATVNKQNDLLHPYQILANYINSLNELLELLKTKNKLVDEELKNKFISERIYKSDGKSSVRANNELLKILNFNSKKIDRN